MLSNFKRFSCALLVAGLLSTTSVYADDKALTVEQGAAVRARIDSAVARAATGGNFSITEVNGDFMRYRGRVGSLISFLERRNEEKKRRKSTQLSEREIKQRTLKSQQDRLDTFMARAQSGACGSGELQALLEYIDALKKETDGFITATEAIDREVKEIDEIIAQAEHDIRFLTPFSQITENSTGQERPAIDRLMVKQGSNTYFEATMNIEQDILAALREARDGFKKNAEEALETAQKHRTITAEYMRQRNELADRGTQKQHVLLEKLAVIDNSYEAWTRTGVNAGLDLAECAVEGKSPGGALIVALSKLGEAIMVYKLTGEQAWSSFDPAKLEAYYQINGNVDVRPAWLMLSTKSWLIQQAAKLPNTLGWEALQGTLEVKEEMIKASMAALKETEKQTLEAMEREVLRKVERILAEEGLEASKAAFMAEASKPNKAQLLRSMYAEIRRLRGVNSEAAQVLLQAAKISYMREISGVTNGAIDAARMRALYEIVNEQRAALRAADEALSTSVDAVRQLKNAGKEAEEAIKKLNIKDAIKKPDGLNEIFKKGGWGAVKGFLWDTLRSGAQTALDEYYGANWINFYKAYMEVDVVIHQLRALNTRWKDDYNNLRRVEKELSDAIAMRDAAERFYYRYLSKLQGTEGLHVVANEIPRTAAGGLLMEVKGTGALYGHKLTLMGDAGYVDLEPAAPLPSYNTIDDPQVREAVEQSARGDTFTYKTPNGFALRNICRAAAGQGNAGGKCDIRVTAYYQ